MAFFVSSYAVPLIVIVILYIVMLRRLWRPSPAMAITRSTRRPQPGNKSHQQNSNRNGWVVIHTYENEDYRNSDFDDNAGCFFSKCSPKISGPKTFFIKTPMFLLKTQFSGKNIEFYHIRVCEKLIDRIKTEPNFKTQAQNFPKAQFFGNSSCCHNR